ncbi:MAG: O-antigen ligase domain-containing protein, partial [Symploca sp. SIO1C4]|nr:O-antigen ligase domain-containing protein [Symploca sp. SIO1C4]
MKPQNLEETLVWYYITGTYVLFFLGAQYVVAPMLAYFLVLYLVKKLWEQNEETPPEERISIPLGVWIWIVAMLVMGLALVVGHLEFNLGTVKTIKSFVNSFLRTWALLAVFPLIGCLKIRPQLIYRA